ncbi:type II secretion system protein GspF [Variovorax paradoxus]|jgi:general secretion pathway protein F|uniref:type II secretion system inner membrane protein GspF n=1 Tax=Variovorax TaxID=34072 RepID=UPI0006E4AE74|nr:type II secretion system inner membrane protein GspF [Variovorax sp. CY25R-8]KPU97294.1 type II secretion system protein GspF [Variovorax paradoxus]KPV10978.1 type II secretion system protein GspF [Variovorax paradoxus]KPV13515.1 type II secretion system protein GspF [Variovorax paradoxus]KPV24232.1 type II secretion system protein GspF [Variovorax paradoxus]KPV32764.1 type II secretion system protein GspF [Variovorax paradoxus]
MPRFQFEAANQAGQVQSGAMEAESVRAVRLQLRDRGLTALEVRETRSGSGQSWFSPKLGAADLCWATRELASLLSARLPLESALMATIEQAEHKVVAESLTVVCNHVRGGMRLADALGEQPRDFPAIYRALVSAGEDSGDLARVMERLADYLESRDNLQSKMLTAFIYPAVVAFVSVCIVIFLLGYVVPQVVSAFSQARQELPMLTQVMLGASAFVREWGVLAGLAIGGAVGCFRWRLRDDAFRLRWHDLLLRTPMLGKYVLGVNTARFASTLAILMDAGVPLLRSLDAARQTMGNERLKACAADTTARVREGAPLAAALKVQKVFPSNLIHLVASGEKTGALAPMLDRAAANLSRDLERRATRLTALLEPLMILGMGGVVMLIVLAVLLPIMEINQMVQ